MGKKKEEAMMGIASSEFLLAPKKAIRRTLLLYCIIFLHKNMTYVIKSNIYDIISLSRQQKGETLSFSIPCSSTYSVWRKGFLNKEVIANKKGIFVVNLFNELNICWFNFQTMERKKERIRKCIVRTS